LTPAKKANPISATLLAPALRDVLTTRFQRTSAIVAKVRKRYPSADDSDVWDLLDQWSDPELRKPGDPIVEAQDHVTKAGVHGVRYRLTAKKNPKGGYKIPARAWIDRDMRELRKRDKDTRAKRDAALVGTSAGCAIKRKDVTAWCQAKRRKIRAEAKRKLGDTKAHREELRDIYRRERGAAKKSAKRKKLSRAESDSLAEHNIDPRHVDLWREVRHLFPYADAPDKRAELFGEWLEEHPQEVYAWEQERYGDQDLSEAEAEYYRQTA